MNTLFNEQFKSLTKIFNHLKNDYDITGNTEKSKDIVNLLIDTLNGKLFKTDSIVANVDKIYFSYDANSNYVITIMPKVDLNRIMYEDGIIKPIDPLSEYYLEISTEALKIYSAEELAAWFMHEYISNLYTQFTNNRIRKRLLSLYDKNKVDVHTFNVSKSIINYLLYSFYSNTFKTRITDESDDCVSNILRELDCASAWNTAIDKFIWETGGDPNIISHNKLVDEDNAVLYTFNILNRKYSTNQLKFKDNLYHIFSKYGSTEKGSTLLYDLIFKVPDSYMLSTEKRSFIYFDDRKIFLESASNINSDETLADIQISDINNKMNNITKLYNCMEADSEKLVIISKINNLIKLIEYMKSNRDKCCSTIKNFDMTKELNEHVHTLQSYKANIEKFLDESYNY